MCAPPRAGWRRPLEVVPLARPALSRTPRRRRAPGRPGSRRRAHAAVRGAARRSRRRRWCTAASMSTRIVSERPDAVREEPIRVGEGRARAARESGARWRRRARTPERAAGAAACATSIAAPPTPCLMPTLTPAPCRSVSRAASIQDATCGEEALRRARARRGRAGRASAVVVPGTRRRRRHPSRRRPRPPATAAVPYACALGGVADVRGDGGGLELATARPRGRWRPGPGGAGGGWRRGLTAHAEAARHEHARRRFAAGGGPGGARRRPARSGRRRARGASPEAQLREAGVHLPQLPLSS